MSGTPTKRSIGIRLRKYTLNTLEYRDSNRKKTYYEASEVARCWKEREEEYAAELAATVPTSYHDEVVQEAIRQRVEETNELREVIAKRDIELFMWKYQYDLAAKEASKAHNKVADLERSLIYYRQRYEK